MVASSDDAHHLVPTTARTVGRLDAIPPPVGFTNQSNRRTVVGNFDIVVSFQVR
jgi:hypothetical protein